MPKMKTKSAAKKRFQVTGGGHLKRKHGQVDLGTMPTDDFAAMIRKQVEEEQNKR